MSSKCITFIINGGNIISSFIIDYTWYSTTHNLINTIIYDNELHEIRKLWITERSDWDDSLPQIYREVMKEDLNWIHDDNQSYSENEKKY